MKLMMKKLEKIRSEGECHKSGYGLECLVGWLVSSCGEAGVPTNWGTCIAR